MSDRARPWRDVAWLPVLHRSRVSDDSLRPYYLAGDIADLGSSAAMLLTISTSVSPATDLGFLLHKNPDRVHEKELSFGTARVCYPEASPERCTAALIVDIDPVQLVRSRHRGPSGNDFSLAQYVNDRPYVASISLGRSWQSIRCFTDPAR